jgi:hypothetical protein
MVGNTRAYLVANCTLLYFWISFGRNGFHVNPCPLVGYFYVIFDNHVSPPVYFEIVYFRCFIDYFRVHMLVLILGANVLSITTSGAIIGA